MNRPYKLPTPAELEIIDALYKRSPMSIKEIAFITHGERSLNARMQMLRIKGYVHAEKSGNQKILHHSLTNIAEELMVFLRRHRL